MDNYLNVGYRLFGHRTYIFVDTLENIGKRELVAAGINVTYIKEMIKEGSKCKLEVCMVKSKMEDAFLTVLKGLRNKALLTGCNDYDEICGALNACRDEILYGESV